MGKALSGQLEGLFSDTGSEPEAEKPRVRLEEAVVACLLGGEIPAELAAAELIAVGATPWVLTSSLSRALQGAEGKRAKAVRSQTRPQGRASALVTANALLQKTMELMTRLKTNSRIAFNATTMVVPAYIGAIAGAEAIGVFSGVVPGALCHAMLIPVLLSHYVLMDEASYRRVLPVLALAPLLRLLSLTMPVRQVPQIYWYAMVGTPLLIAVALTARLLDFSWAKLGLRLQPWPPQILVALSGLPLSIAAFLLLRPRPLTTGLDWRDVAVGSLILMVFTGFTEEIIFRGMLQQVAREVFGRASLLCSSALFALVHMGSLSVSYVLFMGLVGLFFGWCVDRTRSIWGVMLAHSILSIGMILVWPSLWW